MTKKLWDFGYTWYSEDEFMNIHTDEWWMREV